MSSVTFEILTTEDDKRVVEFCKGIYAEMGWSEETLGNSVKNEFNEEGDVFIVGKESGEIVCCAGLQRLSPTEVLLKKFYLRKSVRGSGLASRLFDDLIERARSMGYEILVLDVSSNNERAVHFYQKMNMEEYAVTPYPRWWESSVEGQKTHRYFRLAL